MNTAEELLGTSIGNDWTAVQKLPPPDNATGGHASVCYIIENTMGERAFLKAFDYGKAFRSKNPDEALQYRKEMFLFEAALHKICRAEKLQFVASARSSGAASIVGGDYAVHYLVFDLAKSDLGSIRRSGARPNLATKLRCLHQIGLGLAELHSLGIAHQDLRPSNVLIFDHRTIQIGDLGRAVHKRSKSPIEDHGIPGAEWYAPPEQLYEERDPDWNRRRLGCDLYNYGSMIAYVFCGRQMTELINERLRREHFWEEWIDGYSAVLPYVREAFYKAIPWIRDFVPSKIRDAIIQAASELCEPRPELRGHPAKRARQESQFELEPYINLFDRLATIEEKDETCDFLA